MIVKVVLDGEHLDALAEFWCAALDYEALDVWDEAYRNLRPASGGSGPPLVLQRVTEAKRGKNRMHLDLHPDDGPATVDRLAALGARPVGSQNTDYLDEHGTVFQVMSDPEGNEFCVVWRMRPVPWDDASLPRSESI